MSGRPVRGARGADASFAVPASRAVLGSLALALAFAFALTSGCVPRGVAPSAAPAGPPLDTADKIALEHDILRWTNVERIAAGLAPFVWNDRLARVARAHSEEMVRLGYFAHESPVAARRTVMMRAKLAGLDGPRLFVGENLARGNWRDQRARRIVLGWMLSPGHRANILRRDFEHLGVGVAWDGTFVLATQVFSATP